MQPQQDASTNANQPSNWYGMFYFNRADRRVFVPKRHGWGWTVNFARPAAFVVLFAVPLAVTVITTAVLLLAR